MRKRFSFAALRARLPALAPAEKSALVILLALLASGAALRAWQCSGVALGPVDDWRGLRELVTRARAADATPWPCEARPARGAEPSVRTAGFAPKRAGGASSQKKKPAGVVDLNTAGERQLTALPGVGPSTAKAILAYRAANGRFAAPEELLNVKGIGPKKFEALRAHVKVSGPRPAPAKDTGEAGPRQAPPADPASPAP